MIALRVERDHFRAFGCAQQFADRRVASRIEVALDARPVQRGESIAD